MGGILNFHGLESGQRSKTGGEGGGGKVSGRVRRVLVVMVGGCTLAELSSLRYFDVSSDSSAPRKGHVTVLTSKIMDSKDALRQMCPSDFF